jgi:hypothetical protein
MIIYDIKNMGKKLAHNVQLRYKNVSKDEEEKKVLLDSQDTAILNLGDIAGRGSTGDRFVLVDFNLATTASFKFEVLYQDVTMDTKELVISKLPSRLELIPLCGTSLLGKERFFLCQIKRGATNSSSVDMSKLKLLVTKTPAESTARLLYNQQEVTQLAGTELGSRLGKGGIKVIFKVDPGTATNVSFTVQLSYEDSPVSNPQIFTWEADPMKELFDAILNGDVATMKDLLATPDIDIHAIKFGADDESLLQYAVRVGNNLTIVELLLTQGAEVNVVDKLGRTPLLQAIRDGNIEVAKLLIKKGANVKS